MVSLLYSILLILAAQQHSMFLNQNEFNTQSIADCYSEDEGEIRGWFQATVVGSELCSPWLGKGAHQDKAAKPVGAQAGQSTFSLMLMQYELFFSKAFFVVVVFPFWRFRVTYQLLPESKKVTCLEKGHPLAFLLVKKLKQIHEFSYVPHFLTRYRTRPSQGMPGLPARRHSCWLQLSIGYTVNVQASQALISLSSWPATFSGNLLSVHSIYTWPFPTKMAISLQKEPRLLIHVEEASLLQSNCPVLQLRLTF